MLLAIVGVVPHPADMPGVPSGGVPLDPALPD